MSDYRPSYDPRPLVLTGLDPHGRPMVEMLPAPLPSLYFWLGQDAYPEWPIVSGLIHYPAPIPGGVIWTGHPPFGWPFINA